ncbi:MAG: site-specific integrase [Acidimicrobiales bacterium]|nr:site-specific integrase [Acidimicrobiales bacterium]
MAWKAAAAPTVRQQRGRWVVRVDGIDTATGKRRPKQLGTYPTRRAANQAAAAAQAEGITALTDRSTLAWLVDRGVASRNAVGPKAREQHAWAATHIKAGLGGLRLDALDRDDVARWLDDLAKGGKLSRRSVQLCRTILRAVLTDAVDEGLLRRSPAARVGMPRHVVKPDREREVDAWDEQQVRVFLGASSQHRWGAPFRLAVLYGPRRSELLGLKWDDIDFNAATVRIDEAIVEVKGGLVWTPGKTKRSRRTIPVDAVTLRLLEAHRRKQLAERLFCGPAWADLDLVVCTRTGTAVHPRNFNKTLAILARDAGLPHLTSHGLRHTAATHMTRRATDLGQLRAAAEILGHSPDMLMKIYAHALPDSVRSIADRIGKTHVGEGSETG